MCKEFCKGQNCQRNAVNCYSTANVNAIANVNATANVNSGLASGWRSPGSYIVGGMAAMLFLILLGFIILAFSYWKQRENNPRNENGVFGDADCSSRGREIVLCDIEEAGKVLVIMAGNEKPTFLGQAMSLHAQDQDSLV
ncbi:hypothetical protein SUGI_0896390 [Cryptomeria japonica]|nr:hypothetical protein SUGI_0896390 [Cryptomeria japonica]